MMNILRRKNMGWATFLGDFFYKLISGHAANVVPENRPKAHFAMRSCFEKQESLGFIATT
jgi:hypothetical protein